MVNVPEEAKGGYTFLKGSLVQDAIKAGGATFYIRKSTEWNDTVLVRELTEDSKFKKAGDTDYYLHGFLKAGKKDKTGTEYQWNMSKTTRQFLRTKLGSDTAKWDGHEIELETVKLQNGNLAIYPVGWDADK